MPVFGLIVVPAITIFFFMAFALPYKIRVKLFMLPPWAWAIIWGVVVRSTLKGVLGSWSMFVTDLILWPLMHVAKKRTEYQTRLIEEGKLDPETMKRIRGEIEWQRKLTRRLRGNT